MKEGMPLSPVRLTGAALSPCPLAVSGVGAESRIAGTSLARWTDSTALKSQTASRCGVLTTQAVQASPEPS
jgi:hypothetical protein